MSLRLRLTAAITLVLCLTLAVGSVLTYWHAVDKVETEMRAAIAVGTRIVQNALDDGDNGTDPNRRLELLVADFDGDRHLRAVLMTPTGHVTVTSHLEPPAEAAPPWLFGLLAAVPRRVEVSLPGQYRDHGRIYLEADPDNEVSELWNDVRLYYSILTLFCLLVLVLSLAAVGRLLAPLSNLRAAFGRIGGGDYGVRVEPSGPPELASLCEGFNSMGERLRGMEINNRRLRDQLEAVQEEERADLARDLHDEVSPLLFSVDVDATMIRELASGDKTGRIAERAAAIRDSAAQMKRHVKGILGRLRPGVQLDLGVGPAIESLLASWRARDPRVTFSIELPHASWGAAIDSLLHCVIRESVSNALRHGRPSRVGIRLSERVPGWLEAEISDDGSGLPEDGQGIGYGIIGMRERVERVGGRLSVQNRGETRGVVVRAEIPLAAIPQPLGEMAPTSRTEAAQVRSRCGV